MNRFVSISLCLLICMVSLAQTKEPHWVFTYDLGGGMPGSTHYVVKVSDDGLFSAFTEGLPITESGLTKHQFSARLTNDQVRRFVDLALNAHDFIKNPEQPWPDCRSAEMVVINGREKIMRRSGPIDEHWEHQFHTKKLLRQIDKYLPKEMRDLP